jgi:hypothetical protein
VILCQSTDGGRILKIPKVSLLGVRTCGISWPLHRLASRPSLPPIFPSLVVTAGIWPNLSNFAGACGIVNPLTKLKPYDSPASIGPGRLSIPTYKFSAARNEYESFQVACQGPMNSVSVSLSWTAPGGSAVETLIHSTYHVLVNEPSDCRGGVGWFPDILVPQKDVFYGEWRNQITTVPHDQTKSWW